MRLGRCVCVCVCAAPRPAAHCPHTVNTHTVNTRTRAHTHTHTHTHLLDGDACERRNLLGRGLRVVHDLDRRCVRGGDESCVCVLGGGGVQPGGGGAGGGREGQHVVRISLGHTHTHARARGHAQTRTHARCRKPSAPFGGSAAHATQQLTVFCVVRVVAAVAQLAVLRVACRPHLRGAHRREDIRGIHAQTHGRGGGGWGVAHAQCVRTRDTHATQAPWAVLCVASAPTLARVRETAAGPCVTMVMVCSGCRHRRCAGCAHRPTANAATRRTSPAFVSHTVKSAPQDTLATLLTSALTGASCRSALGRARACARVCVCV
jgi:hypothetical protein